MKDNIASRVYEEKHIDKLRTKIKLLGINYDANLLIGLKIVFSIIMLLVLLVIFDIGYILAPLATIIFYFLSEIIIIDFGIKKRTKELENDALDFFPIFLLSLKSGRSIKKAIHTTTKIVDNSLSKEFKIVLNDIKLGKSLEDALYSLQERIPSITINNIILCLIESNKLGNSVDNSSKIQLEYLQEKKNNANIKSLKNISLKLLLTCLCFMLYILIILITFDIIL